MKKGYVFITSSGYDPERGGHVKDPYLGDRPTMGACMPNIRRQVVTGDQIFVISGKVPGAQQYIIGGFEVAEKIDAMAAYRRFPDRRLHVRDDEQLDGNIIITPSGNQHPLDMHSSFATRIENYIVGRDPIALTAPHEIARARAETMDILRDIFQKAGTAPYSIVGRCSRLNEEQLRQLRDWLISVKGGV